MARKKYSSDDIDQMVRDVEGLMSSCANSQPYEDGEPFWMNPSGPLIDLLDNAEVPEELRQEVADRVRCPCCDGKFELYEEVGYKTDGEISFDALRDEWLHIHEDRLASFFTHLERYPYLGLAHELGKEIYASISKLPQSNLPQHSTWYRARRVVDGKERVTTDFQVADPTQVAIPEGRFNHFGQSVIYFADSAHTAAAEVAFEGEVRAWVQKFDISNVGPILDLASQEAWADEETPVLAIGLTHFGHLSLKVERDQHWKPEYFLPRFIADCARMQGIKGVIFPSSRIWGRNLVLFEWNPDCMVPEEEPILTVIPALSHDRAEYPTLHPTGNLSDLLGS